MGLLSALSAPFGSLLSGIVPTSFSTDDAVAIGFLVFLEGILSIDNALVLALLVRHLPARQQKKALVYGIVGAVFFRLVAVSIASKLMTWTWIKFVGGGYLLYLSADYFFVKEKEEKKTSAVARNFWMTVLIVELTDIAFAVDSILTAVALTKKLWVVITGGILGLVLMRFATTIFLKLLDRFPRFETTAYLLVAIIGGKLILEGFQWESVDFHSAKNPWFWIFWTALFGGFLFGFTNGPKSASAREIKS